MSLLAAIRKYRKRRREKSEFELCVYTGNLDRVRQMIDGGFDCRRLRFKFSVLETALASDPTICGTSERTASKLEVFSYLRTFFEPLRVEEHPGLLVGACIAQQTALAKELLELGWSVHSRGGLGAGSPLELAVRSRDAERFDLLVAHGANRNDYRDQAWYRVNAEMIERLAGIGVEVPSDVLEAVKEGRW